MECAEIVKEALDYLEGEIKIEHEEGLGCNIEVPLLRADNDRIQIWVQPYIEESDESQVKITDYGETMGLLYLSNLNIETETRKKRYNRILETYGITKEEDELVVYTSKQRLGESVINFIQGIQGISYLLFTRKGRTSRDFVAQVDEYLDSNDVRYTKNEKIYLETEPAIDIDYSFENGHQSFMNTLHAESSTSAKSMANDTALEWDALMEADEYQEVNLITLVDDVTGETSDIGMRRLQRKSHKVFKWSNREDLIAELTPYIRS